MLWSSLITALGTLADIVGLSSFGVRVVAALRRKNDRAMEAPAPRRDTKLAIDDFGERISFANGQVDAVYVTGAAPQSMWPVSDALNRPLPVGRLQPGSIRLYASLAATPDDCAPQLVPVVFGRHGQHFIGWKTEDTLTRQSDCDTVAPSGGLAAPGANMMNDGLDMPRALVAWAEDAFPGYKSGDSSTYKYLRRA